MNPFDLERAQAYQHLKRWLTEFQDHYDSGQYVGDWFLTSSLLVEKSGDTKFATPQELIAAEVLNCIIQIEATVETGEAFETFGGTTLLEIIKADLRHYLDQLATYAPNSTTNTAMPTIDTVSHGLKRRRDQQLQRILNEIVSLDFDPHAIPDGGKTKIKKICQTDTALFTDSGFDHAWKDGLKAKLFKMQNHDRFAGG